MPPAPMVVVTSYAPTRMPGVRVMDGSNYQLFECPMFALRFPWSANDLFAFVERQRPPPPLHARQTDAPAAVSATKSRLEMPRMSHPARIRTPLESAACQMSNAEC